MLPKQMKSNCHCSRCQDCKKYS